MLDTKTIRPVTVKLIMRLIAPLLDSGLVTNTEYSAISKSLAYLAKKGEEIPPVPPQLLTGPEAAEVLGISFSQFRTLLREGAFPFSRRIVGGRNVRFLNSDIYAYIGIISDFTPNPSLPEKSESKDNNSSINGEKYEQFVN